MGTDGQSTESNLANDQRYINAKNVIKAVKLQNIHLKTGTTAASQGFTDWKWI